MKVAITSVGKGLDAAVDPHFGRAQAFVVIDLETNAIQSVPNSVNLNSAQGAGIQAAKAVAELGVHALLTGHAGPKAFAVLWAAGVTVYPIAGGTVGEAIEQFRAGTLPSMTQADVEGQW